MKLVKDLKIGDNLYIKEPWKDNVLIHTVLSTYSEKDYLYIIDSHKILCFGKLEENTLYSREHSKIYLEDSFVNEDMIIEFKNRIESHKQTFEKIQKKYIEDVEDFTKLIARLEKEFEILKNKLLWSV